MRYSLPYIIPIILFIFIAGGCSDQEAVERLSRAEQVMEEHPDSALMLIQGVDPSRLRTDKDRALYALLRTQALVKNDSVIASDSLIRTAVDYYTRHPRAPYLMKSAFYLGEVQRNLGNLTSAVKSATQAYDLACQADDPYWIAKSAEKLMFIYSDSFNRDESQKYAYIAAENYKRSGHHINHLYSLCDICIDDKNSGRYLTALERIDSVINILNDNEQEQLISYCHIIRFPICIELNDYEEAAKSLYEIKKHSSISPIPLRVYLYEADLYRNTGMTEYAKLLLDSVGKMLDSKSDKALLFNSYNKLYKQEGKFRDAWLYQDSLLNLQNEEVIKLVSSDVALAQKDYYDQNFRAEKNKSKSYKNLITMIR